MTDPYSREAMQERYAGWDTEGLLRAYSYKGRNRLPEHDMLYIREELRKRGEITSPGRPRSGGNGDGQPKISARVPVEVAKWVQSKEPGWLSKLVQSEYDKKN